MIMKAGTVRTVKVAAVQMESKNGEIMENLRHAMPLIEKAAAQGAKLVLLPEFMPPGFELTCKLWDAAETCDGMTVSWLKETSGRLGIYLGTSYLEADGEDFFNTFALAGPDGRIAGTVRKQSPSLAENYFFRGDTGNHVIDTDIGRIGVGICNDNHMAYLPGTIQKMSADIMLMPHSWALPTKPSKAVSQADIDRWHANMKDMAPLYSRLLGIPAVMVNKTGPFISGRPPGFISLMTPDWTEYVFPGHSTISDCDGRVLARTDGEEGFIVADVVLDPLRKKKEKPRTYGHFSYPGSAGRNIMLLMNLTGRFSYRFNGERKKRAAELSSGTCRNHARSRALNL